MRLRLLILGTLLLGLALRLVNLNGRPIWYDEAFAVLYAERSFAEMWYGTVTPVNGAASDVHPLFYYSLLHFWMGIAGESAFAVRFLSVGLGVATISVIFRLARTLLDTPAAIASCVILAVAPFHIAYSQEARMYAQLGLFSALAVWAFVKYDKTRVRGWLLLFALSGAGVMYSHNLGFLIFVVLAGWALYRTKSRGDWALLKATGLGGAGITFLWLPWMMLLPSQLGKIQQAYWVPRPDISSLVQTLITFIVDFDNARLPAALLPFALFAALLLVLLVVQQAVRSRAPGVRLLVLIAIVPPILLFAASQWRPIYITRALMPSFLFLVLAIGWTITRSPRVVRQIISCGLGGLVAISLIAYFGYEEFPRPPYQQALAFLDKQIQPGDAVVHDNKLSFFPMHYYDRGFSQSFVSDPQGAGSDTLALPTQQAIQIFGSSLQSEAKGRDRVWFVVFDEAVKQGSGNLAWMNQSYRLTRSVNFNDLDLYLYEK